MSQGEGISRGSVGLLQLIDNRNDENLPQPAADSIYSFQSANLEGFMEAMLKVDQEPASQEGQERHTGSGRWLTVVEALGEEEAASLKSQVQEEFDEPNVVERLWGSMLNGQQLGTDRHAVMVLGTSASGKSHLMKRFLMARLPGAIELDGEVVRMQSPLWSAQVHRAHEAGLTGFTDLFKGYFHKHTTAMKKELLKRACKVGANLVVPDTCSNDAKVILFVESLLAAGYKVHFCVVLASKARCEKRGYRREHSDGKKYDSNSYAKSIANISKIIREYYSDGAAVGFSHSRINQLYTEACSHEAAEACIDHMLDPSMIADWVKELHVRQTPTQGTSKLSTRGGSDSQRHPSQTSLLDIPQLCALDNLSNSTEQLAGATESI